MRLDKTLERIGLQWCYILVSPDFPWRVKVGWSGSFNARISDIQATISREVGRRVKIYCIFKMPLFWAKRAEDSIHSFPTFRYLKADMPGSGRTEWAWILNVYVACMVYLLMLGQGHPAPEWPAAFALLFPIALDFIFFLITLAFLQYGFVGLIVYCIWNTFF